MRCALAIGILVLFSIQITHAQPTHHPEDSLSSYFTFEDLIPLSCLITYFPPFFIQNGLGLKSFIRSDTFQKIRLLCGDLRAVDAIYIQAMRLTNNNTAISLFLSTIACFDHRIVGVRVPFFQLYFPLSNESEEDFVLRVSNLPSGFYGDSPLDSIGDRDKLQHFFGSAFFAFLFESSSSARRIGDFVEKGEDELIVDGIYDERDRRANRQGQEFGIALLEDNHHLPSEFLRFEIALQDTPSTGHMIESTKCVGVW